MSAESSDALIRTMANFLRSELPRLNTNAEKSGDAEPLIVAVEPWLYGIKKLLADGAPDRRSALRLLQVAGFAVSSLERHLQTARHPKGAGVERLGMKYALLRLGDIARHIPRDDHLLYWLDNRDDPITFTGTSGEILFNRNVNLTQDLLAVSASALRPICDGNVPLASIAAPEAIRFAAVNIEKIHANFRVFMEQPTKGTKEWTMTPLVFMRMRQYLVEYPIGESIWSGPNAANIVAQPQVDFLLGTVLDFYIEIVKERFSLWSPEEQTAVADDMARPSIFKQLFGALSLDDRSEESIRASDIVEALERRPTILASVDAIASLVAAAAHLSAYHIALIANYLEKPQFPPDIVEKAIVPPTRGTGTHGHTETRRIMEMRAKHPLGEKIVAAARIAKDRVGMRR